MGTGTKLIAHEGMGSGMGIFLKRGYGDGHYGTLPNGYPLPSLSGLMEPNGVSWNWNVINGLFNNHDR